MQQEGNDLDSAIDFDSADSDNDLLGVREYSIKSTPNDFNVLTITSFMDSGAIHIPAFQRHYVWDQTRASRLIESLILGLPIPQTFWYEEGPNKFLVIDGQQRLLTLYFFIKGRFPRKDVRAQLRELAVGGSSALPDEVLHNDELFQDFKLRLKMPDGESKHPLHGLSYKALGDRQNQFNLRPIRNIILSQTTPSEDDSSIFEIFHRLNSGGVALRHQEIRASLFYGPFFDLLTRLNLEPSWRIIAGERPNARMLDVEAILRGFAMAKAWQNYKPTLPRFLNEFAKKNRTPSSEETIWMESVFGRFISSFSASDATLFVSQNRRFSPTLYESAFAAAAPFLSEGRSVDPASVARLAQDADFRKATEAKAGDTANVRARIEAALRVVSPVN